MKKAYKYLICEKCGHMSEPDIFTERWEEATGGKDVVIKTKPPSEDWQERFEKEIYPELTRYGRKGFMVLIEDFISKELQTQREELIEKLEKMIDTKAFGGILNRRNEILRQAIQTIKK